MPHNKSMQENEQGGHVISSKENGILQRLSMRGDNGSPLLQRSRTMNNTRGTGSGEVDNSAKKL
eukprot:15344122-Ditylum_brightwellii.AAC.3